MSLGGNWKKEWIVCPWTFKAEIPEGERTTTFLCVVFLKS